MGFSDLLLDLGCARQIEAAHGEAVTVMSGVDAGKIFLAVRETEDDLTVNMETGGTDPRSRRVLRFRTTGAVPRLSSQDVVKTASGDLWRAIRAPRSGYLTTDFELIEILAGKDT
jgi:hypothetical protein